MTPVEASTLILRAFDAYRNGSLNIQNLEKEVLFTVNQSMAITEIVEPVKFKGHATPLHEKYYKDMGIAGEGI